MDLIMATNKDNSEILPDVYPEPKLSIEDAKYIYGPIFEYIDKKDKKKEDFNEKGLPVYLQKSIQAYTSNSDKMIDDCLYCELQSDINSAEQESEISSEQAWFLRKKYLGISNEIDTEDIDGIDPGEDE